MLDIADFTRARRHMVANQIEGRGIRDPAVLTAMRAVPREAFLRKGLEEFAYRDSPLPIGEGQTISQPFVVALMIEAAQVKPGDSVLEVGAGSGYAAAILSRIAGKVHGIERHPALVEQAQRRLAGLGYDNVRLRAGDGTRGWPEAAPFDAIIVSARGPSVPQALKDQLAIGGRLVMPVGDENAGQSLVKITRRSATDFATQDDLAAVRFVPLIGEEAWVRPDTERPRPGRPTPSAAR
ncbi:protein-L-isoaspartate O-methyltransferase [Bosea sp. Root381]|uniref:protein-L-isoaspartate(D-aspartate) O-methyltransferase n=1 Tax=Bosea sp. Root381 TaxID=1736524 RepID=UPI0006F3114D|nr:protein-L-isoaspartate(D-aspartate) O-methyltransferase [Bosea sp. Root381]KRE07550.1 protein-L-isoaspartate O-methyltransferase [Bosea sp. Root381]